MVFFKILYKKLTNFVDFLKELYMINFMFNMIFFIFRLLLDIINFFKLTGYFYKIYKINRNQNNRLKMFFIKIALFFSLLFEIFFNIFVFIFLFFSITFSLKDKTFPLYDFFNAIKDSLENFLDQNNFVSFLFDYFDLKNLNSSIDNFMSIFYPDNVLVDEDHSPLITTDPDALRVFRVAYIESVTPKQISFAYNTMPGVNHDVVGSNSGHILSHIQTLLVCERAKLDILFKSKSCMTGIPQEYCQVMLSEDFTEEGFFKVKTVYGIDIGTIDLINDSFEKLKNFFIMPYYFSITFFLIYIIINFNVLFLKGFYFLIRSIFLDNIFSNFSSFEKKSFYVQYTKFLNSRISVFFFYIFSYILLIFALRFIIMSTGNFLFYMVYCNLPDKLNVSYFQKHYLDYFQLYFTHIFPGVDYHNPYSVYKNCFLYKAIYFTNPFQTLFIKDTNFQSEARNIFFTLINSLDMDEEVRRKFFIGFGNHYSILTILLNDGLLFDFFKYNNVGTFILLQHLFIDYNILCCIKLLFYIDLYMYFPIFAFCDAFSSFPPRGGGINFNELLLFFF